MFRIKLVVGIAIIIYASFSMMREKAEHERNYNPKENLRHARSDMVLWFPGVSGLKIPNSGLDRTAKLLREISESEADESLKQEALAIQKKLDQFPNYVRFANKINEISGRFEEVRAAIDHVGVPEGWRDEKPDFKIPPNSLVITERRHESEPGSDDEDDLYFDAEMNEALGKTIAVSSDGLKTIVVLRFFRTEIGEYVPKSPQDEISIPKIGDEDKELPWEATYNAKVPRYFHSCNAMVIDLPTKSIIYFRPFSGLDPEEIQVGVIPFNGESEKTYLKLREEAREWIRRVSS